MRDRLICRGYCWLPLFCLFTTLSAQELPPEVGSVYRHIVYATVSDAPVLMDLYLPAVGQPPYPWLIRYSSSIERLDSNGLALLRAGYALAYADHGSEAQVEPSPPWPQFPIMVRRGIRYLRAHAADYGLDSARAGVWGWSRGGSAALLAASCWWVPEFHDGSYAEHSDRVLTGMIIAGNFGMVPGDLQGNDLAMLPAQEDDHFPTALQRVAAWVSPAMPPLLFLRGERDQDPADMLAMVHALRGLEVTTESWIVPGAGHGLSSPAVQQRLVAWAEQHIRHGDVQHLLSPLDPLAAAQALHHAGLHEAAEQVYQRLADPTAANDDLLRVARQRALITAAQAVAEHTPSLTALAQAMDPLLDLPITEHHAVESLHRTLAERQERAAAQAQHISSLRAANGQPWPQDLAVPTWASDHGSDGFGFWAELQLSTPHGQATQRFRWCPAGSALLGVPTDSWGVVAPEPGPETITVKQGFWLADTEVTQAFWLTVHGERPAHHRDNDQHPVERISHPRAEQFIDELRRLIPDCALRLPSRSEWLWAARSGGTDTAVFGVSDDLDAVAWWSGNSGGSTQAVATRLPTSWGLYDMLGNVFEWTNDPQRERPHHYRTYLGGSYLSSAARCRPETLARNNRDNTTPYHGLRLLIEDQP